MTVPSRVLFVSGSGASATLRYRVRLPEEALRSLGVRTAAVHFTDRRAAALGEQADVVVLYRCPGGEDLVDLVRHLRERPVPPLVTYDVDDLVFRPEHLDGMDFLDSFTERQRQTFTSDVSLRARLVPYADLVTGSTQQILDELSLLTDAPNALLPNGVGIVGLGLADSARSVARPDDGLLRIGYFSGSATHDADWASIEPAVVEFLGAHPEARLHLVGKVQATAGLASVAGQVQASPLVEWYELPALLRSVDITLAPLDRNQFTEAKSAIKWLEAALVETVTVATPTPPFEAAIDPGRTGLLADSTQDWLDAMTRLAADPGLRAQLGQAARIAALEDFGPEAQAGRLVEALGVAGPPSPRAYRGAPMPHRWRPVPVLLQPYPFPAELRPLRLRPAPAKAPAAAILRGAAEVDQVTRKAYSRTRRLVMRTGAKVLGRR